MRTDTILFPDMGKDTDSLVTVTSAGSIFFVSLVSTAEAWLAPDIGMTKRAVGLVQEDKRHFAGSFVKIGRSFDVFAGGGDSDAGSTCGVPGVVCQDVAVFRHFAFFFLATFIGVAYHAIETFQVPVHVGTAVSVHAHVDFFGQVGEVVVPLPELPQRGVFFGFAVVEEVLCHPPGLSSQARVECAHVVVAVFHVAAAQVGEPLVEVSGHDVGLREGFGVVQHGVGIFGLVAAGFGRHQLHTGFADACAFLLQEVHHFLRCPGSKVHIGFVLYRDGIDVYAVLLHEVDVADKVVGVVGVVFRLQVVGIVRFVCPFLGDGQLGGCPVAVGQADNLCTGVHRSVGITGQGYFGKLVLTVVVTARCGGYIGHDIAFSQSDFPG